MSYRDFDFELAIQEGANPRRIAWLRENFDKPITEEQFVQEIQLVRSFSSAKKNSRVYCASHLKQTYKKLKKNYGFFTT